MKRAIDSGLTAALEAANQAAESVERFGKSLMDSALRLPGLSLREERRHGLTPGGVAGIEAFAEVATPPPPDTIKISCYDYCPERVVKQEVSDLAQFLAEPAPDWVAVRWVNVDGLHPFVVNQFREHYHLHTLAAEDVLHVPQRPKMDVYDDHLFVVTRMLMIRDGKLHVEQVSMFYEPRTLITFQETSGDVWLPIRQRLEVTGSRARESDVGYLLYALLDATVDHFFPILEHYGDLLEGMESTVIDSPTPDLLQRIHGIKRELVLLRRVIWPLRDTIDALHRDEEERLSPQARTYLRDVYDHTIQVLDIVESYRELVGSLTDLYMSAVSNRMNEIMKVLTIMASFFIPVTFVAGVYGMNFEHIPELGWKYAYAAFWGVCLSIVLGLLIFFRRRNWL